MEYENHKKIVICYPQPKLDKSQISPKEFLKWAKYDLKKSQDKRALGNALGNEKAMTRYHGFFKPGIHVVL